MQRYQRDTNLVLSKALIAGFLHLRLQFPRGQRSQLGAGVWFLPFSLVFEGIFCSGRRKSGRAKLALPITPGVKPQGLGVPPQGELSSPQEKSKLWRQLSSANLGQALICWQAKRNWPGFSYFIFWDEWNCSAHYDGYLTLIAEEVTEDLLIW